MASWRTNSESEHQITGSVLIVDSTTGQVDKSINTSGELEKSRNPDSISSNGLREEKHVDENMIETPEGEEPSEYEKKTLRHVGESLPFAVFLVAVIELCERFTYYGCQGIFQNYVSRPLDGSQGVGALGMGPKGATGLVTFYSFWCYLTPLAGGYIADSFLGKYKTILCSTAVYFAGLLILVCTAIPSSLRAGAGTGGYITSILLTGIGTGGIKANVAPLIAEQYKRRTMAIAITKKGERVVIDPYVTIQRIFMIFYWCINVGALSLLATPYLERDVGFWSAYLLCICVFLIGITILVLGRKQYVDRPPSGSVVGHAFRIVGQMIRYRNTNAAKSNFRTEKGLTKPVPWTDSFVDEVKRALQGCKVFCIYPVFWVCYGQFSGKSYNDVFDKSNPLR